MHRMWFNEYLPGEMGQILPSPRHFEQLQPLVTEEMIAEQGVCGDDVDEHVAALTAFADAGFEHDLRQPPATQRGFFDFYRTKVLPQLPGPEPRGRHQPSPGTPLAKRGPCK
ncbi:Glucose-6-phosphate dehydrogenase, F420-dependent OS=Streptomyces glaucescens OX=1907 GN=SGLAU_27345 PE=4 SV=1 [Streptomyces glaucescens]